MDIVRGLKRVIFGYELYYIRNLGPADDGKRFCCSSEALEAHE